jgi:hypothetical protein
MGSTLDLTPRTSARGVGSNADPTTPYAAYSAAGQALARASRPDYFGWLDHIRAAAGCTRPIRLTGTLDTVDPATGQRLNRRHTDIMPDHTIYKACGNRRATVCPTCARTYQADAYQLLRAGLIGGKGVPDTVSRHPAVFATFTAPTFGPSTPDTSANTPAPTANAATAAPTPATPAAATTAAPDNAPTASRPSAGHATRLMIGSSASRCAWTATTTTTKSSGTSSPASYGTAPNKQPNGT